MRDFLLKNKFYIGIGVVIILAVFSRVYYSCLVYNYTFSSGDAAGYVLRALYFQKEFFLKGLNLEVGSLSHELFAVPFFVSYLLGLFSDFLGISLYSISFFITSITTIIGIIFLYYLLYNRYGFFVSFFSSLLIAINSYISFYSTEPLKAPFIVSFFIIALYLLNKGGNKKLVLAFIFAGLTLFVHITGIFFLCSFYLLFIIDSFLNKKKIFNFYSILGTMCVFIIVGTYWYLKNRFYFSIEQDIGIVNSSDNGFVGSEILAFLSNVKGGGHNFGFSTFIKGIKNQVGVVIFLGGLGGVLITTLKKRFNELFLLVPFGIVFLGFSLKWVASSHGSRYPFYVNWLFIIFFVIFLLFALDIFKEKKKIYISCLLFLCLLFGNNFYNVLAGGREQYLLNREAGLFIKNNLNLSKENKILLVGWPETLLGVYDGDDLYKNQYLIKYGWKDYRYLSEMVDEDFIKSNHIKYFLYEKTGGDYFNSFNFLKKAFINRIEEVVSFSDKGKIVVLYKFK